MGGFVTAFGVACILTGSDGVVISAVFGLLGTIAGYIFGSQTQEENP